MDNLNKVTREFGMKINVKKTKVMCISHKGNNKLKAMKGSTKEPNILFFIYLLFFFLGYCQCLRPYNPVHTVYMNVMFLHFSFYQCYLCENK